MLRFGCLHLALHDHTSLAVIRDTIQALQRSYVKLPELLHGIVPSDVYSYDVVAISCPDEDPTSDDYLQALLFVDLNEERKPSGLGAMVAWGRYVNGKRRLEEPPLWEETLDL